MANSDTGTEKKKGNPLLEQASVQYREKLLAEGVAEGDVDGRVKDYVDSTIRPALKAARKAGKEKNLDGKELRQFVRGELKKLS